MGRAPCCDKANVKKGPWSPEEDARLKEYIEKYGTGGNWIALPQKSGLKRCGKSCRLRWLNYLRPNIKHGEFTDEEDRIICSLFTSIGSRWSIIAAQLPGRTDNDIKNYWNTKLKKKLMGHHNHDHNQNQNQKKTYPNQQPSILHNSSSPLLSPYQQCSLYNSPSALTFTTLDQNSFSNPYTPPFGYMSSPMQNYLMLGGAEASCSSSDGSSHEYGSAPIKYYYDGLEQNHKIMGSGGEGGKGLSEETLRENGFAGEIGLEYYSDLEEIKKLISSNGCNNFPFDENKTVEEAVMMYYG